MDLTGRTAVHLLIPHGLHSHNCRCLSTRYEDFPLLCSPTLMHSVPLTALSISMFNLLSTNVWSRRCSDRYLSSDLICQCIPRCHAILPSTWNPPLLVVSALCLTCLCNLCNKNPKQGFYISIIFCRRKYVIVIWVLRFMWLNRWWHRNSCDPLGKFYFHIF